ncbi:MFS transporter superfamily protein [Pleurotus pulmonarius]
MPFHDHDHDCERRHESEKSRALRVDVDIEYETTPTAHPKKIQRTPLPWFQFSILLFLQLAEPLTSQVIYPFVPQLVREIGVTGGDESKVGYYVGIMQSLFFVAEATTVLHWSRLSDRIGRKPVILFGLFGLSISMYCFGLSKTFWGLVLSRCLNGGLNGNVGVMKSIIAEMTDETNISQAYSFMPIAWSTGSTIGPILGGALAHPVDRFPELFGESKFLAEHPYFLPCSIPATFTIVAWIITLIFLKETSPVKQRPFSRHFRRWFPKAINKAANESSSFDASARETREDPRPAGPGEELLPMRKLLTRRVLIASGNYAILAFVDISFRAIQPLFLSTPIALGGLGLAPSMIGPILSVFGVLNGLMQVSFFASIHDRWGSKRVFTAGILSTLPAFALFPLINHYARTEGLSVRVYFLVWCQIVISIGVSMSYGAIFILISEAAPNHRSLGAVNGLSQMAASVMRGVGPIIASSLFSLSVGSQILGGRLVYFVLSTIVLMAVGAAGFLPRRGGVRLRSASASSVSSASSASSSSSSRAHSGSESGSEST